MMIGQPAKQAWLAAGCVVAGLLWIGSHPASQDFFRHRRLAKYDTDIGDHYPAPDARTADAMNYDKTILQLMSSPCRPEADGYFGSTSGVPLEIQYGFQLETEDEDNLEYLLDEINEQIIDVVLSSAFPNLCGFRRRKERERNLGVRGLSSVEYKLMTKPRTTGFQFSMDLQQKADTCPPQEDPTNMCGVYKSSISVFGRNLSTVGVELLEKIRETLKGEQKRLSADGLVRLTTVDSLTHQTGDYQQAPNAIRSLGFATKAAIAIVIIAALAGLATAVMYVHLERKKRQKSHRPYMDRDKKNMSNRTLGVEDETSQVSETIGLRDGTAVVLEGGRPVVIEFEHDLHRKRSAADAASKARSAASRTQQATPTSISHASPTRSRATRSLQSSQMSRTSGTISPNYSPNYAPRAIRRPTPLEESKSEEPEAVQVEGHNENIQTAQVLPVDPMGQSVISSASEYTEQTCSVNDRGEYT